VLICSRCREEFVDIHSDNKNKFGHHVPYRLCPDCREKQSPESYETDSWQYLRKPEGYRITAGFNLISGEKV
jgi:hypothetical protein